MRRPTHDERATQLAGGETAGLIVGIQSVDMSGECGIDRGAMTDQAQRRGHNRLHVDVLAVVAADDSVNGDDIVAEYALRVACAMARFDRV